MTPDVLEVMADEITRGPLNPFALAFGWTEGWAVEAGWRRARQLGDEELLAQAAEDERLARGERLARRAGDKPRQVRRNKAPVRILTPAERRAAVRGSQRRYRRKVNDLIRQQREERRRWLELLGWPP